MPKIKTTENTVIEGIGHVDKGKVKSVSERVAKDLFVAGKAVPFQEPAKKPAGRKPKVTERGDAD